VANQLVLNNFFLADRAGSAYGKLNTASRLRLYQSSIVPDPSDTLATYTPHECNFDSYSVKTLTAGWATPTQVMNGEYQTLSLVANYSSPASVGNTIYGLFVDDNGGNLLFAMLFDVPINYTAGAPALSMQIGYQVWAKSIIP
jgi:hypothetical protein